MAGRGTVNDTREGGRILVDNLVAQGVNMIFQVPGESFLPVLDALGEAPLRTITCRHESGAANMAEAYGKLTGRPGVCIVTRGPGACHAAVGVHTARQDSTPMVLLVGQVDRPLRGREAFQEVDLHGLFGWTAKAVTEVDDAAALPDAIAEAWRMAMTGRPGPVVIGLPEDMLTDRVSVADAARVENDVVAADAADVDAALAALAGASRPLVIAGGSRWSQETNNALAAFAAAWALPVCVSFRRQDHLDNTHDSYAGDLSFAPDPALSQAVREADLILALGTRLGDLTTGGFESIAPPNPTQTLIHVFPDRDEMARNFTPDVAVIADPGAFLTSALKHTAPATPTWRTWTDERRAAYTATLDAVPCPGALDMNAVIAALRERLELDDIITTDAGNFAQWVQRFYPFRRHRTQIAPTGGAMGYGVPAGVAAGLIHPTRRVVTFAGDGGFMMTGNELATAAQYGVRTVFVVVNNGMFGTIRAHQERRYPARPHGTDLQNPDFTALGQSFGLFAQRVARTDEIAAAFDAALAHDGPALIELILDAEAASTNASLTQIREKALAG